MSARFIESNGFFLSELFHSIKTFRLFENLRLSQMFHSFEMFYLFTMYLFIFMTPRISAGVSTLSRIDSGTFASYKVRFGKFARRKKNLQVNNVRFFHESHIDRHLGTVKFLVTRVS